MGEKHDYNTGSTAHSPKSLYTVCPVSSKHHANADIFSNYGKDYFWDFYES